MPTLPAGDPADPHAEAGRQLLMEAALRASLDEQRDGEVRARLADWDSAMADVGGSRS
jgi:hypothetical protein